jgi:hypothetical protein
VAPAQVEAALELARGIEHKRDRTQALAALGQVNAALELARGIEDKRDRAQALAELAPHLAEPGQVEAALGLARGIESEGARAQALVALAPRLEKLPRSQALPLWEDTLRLSATRSRPDVLADLGSFAAVITLLGGSDAIDQACQTIQDVGQWWP